MSKTATDTELLVTCVQDLHAGCCAFARRFPALAPCATDDALRACFKEFPGQAAARGRRLEVIEKAADGPENLWMAGMLDDAARDMQTIAAGRHLDLALIGAVRKMLVAERVSVETAIVLARKLMHESLVQALQDNHAELRDLDASLSAALERIAGCSVAA